MEKSEKERKLANKLIYTAFCIIVFLGIFLLFSNLNFLEKISPELKGTVYLFRKAIFDPTSYQSGEMGSIERVYIPLYVIYHYQYILFGAERLFQTGRLLVRWDFHILDNLTYRVSSHWEGFSFCIIVFSIYNYFYLQLIGKVKNKTMFRISNFMVIFFYFFYTRPWTQSTLSICLLMLFVPMGMLANKVFSEECA